MYRLFEALLKLSSHRVQRKVAQYLERGALIRSLKALEDQGHPVDVIYDIGAHRGNWSKMVKRDFPASKIFMFEANETYLPELKATGLPVFFGVLAAERKTVKFYSKGTSGDSIFQERTTVFDDVAAQEYQANRLDDVASENDLPPPTLIKMDTQGAELEVLRGGPNAFGSAKFVYTEAPIVNFNEGAPGIQEYITAFYEAGYLPHDVCEIHSIAGVLVQIDILFVKKELLVSRNPKVDKLFKGHLL